MCFDNISSKISHWEVMWPVLGFKVDEILIDRDKLHIIISLWENLVKFESIRE